MDGLARTTRRLPIALAAAVLFAVGPILGASSAQAEATLRLESPVDCRLGEDCWVQFYVDRDPGPESLDYACGSLSYDGH